MIPVDDSNAEHYKWGDNCDGWHLLKTPGLSVIRERVPAGASEIRHYHSAARQFFYVLSGTATLEIGEEAVSFTAGQGVQVPPGTPHRFLNGSDRDVLFLVISAPSTVEDRTDLEVAARSGSSSSPER